MVDAGRRAASVTIYRVMDIEHGLGNVTGDIMLSTLLNHVTHLGKQECLGRRWIQSDSQQFVWLEELQTVFTVQEILMNVRQLTMTFIETEDSLRGSCCAEKHRLTSHCAKNPDLALWCVEVVDEAAKQRLGVKEESYKAYIEEELSLRKRRREIDQARPWRHWA